MGRDLARGFPAARLVFEEADEALGTDLSRLMWDGPERELTLTRNAQPAIFVHSLATHAAMRERIGGVAFAAGHSLGEFSAHVAAGTLSFADALGAVRLRGELMFAAGLEHPGTMAAVLGLDDDVVRRVCAGVRRGVCVPANFNSEGQVVISGDHAGVGAGIAGARAAGAKGAMELNVSGAFHSPLMEPARSGLAAHLGELSFTDPEFPVVCNATAAAVTSAAETRELLVRQLTAPVLWSRSIATMLAAGANRFLELGPGTVLCGLNRRNARGASCASVGSPADTERWTP